MTRAGVFILVASSVAIGAFLTGCTEANQNADKSSRDTGPAAVINFPKGFRNVAHKCDGPNMVYSTSYGNNSAGNSAVTVVANDPRCPGSVGK